MANPQQAGSLCEWPGPDVGEVRAPQLGHGALRPAPGAGRRQVLLQTPVWMAGTPRLVWTTTQDRVNYNDKSYFGHMVAFQVSREDLWLLYPILQRRPVTSEGSIGQAALD